MDIGLEKLSGGHKVNINASASLLLSDLDILHALPAKQIGIEILEAVPITDSIIKACQQLKEKGFTIILDDVVYAPHLKPLLKVADMIKVDLPRVSSLIEEVRTLRQYPVKLLAEKVETYTQFEQVKALNFEYVQGYFSANHKLCKGEKSQKTSLPF